jgi:hypothetical protein
MLQYKAVTGQSVFDLCLNTYGSFDLLFKFLNDNNISDVNYVPYSGQVFYWDETLTADQAVNVTSTTNSIIYATSTQRNGSVLSIVLDQGNGGGAGNGGIYPPYTPPTTGGSTSYYITYGVQYVGVGAENTFNLSELVGVTLVQVTREVQPLLPSMYTFNALTGSITLTGNALIAEEVVYIIYTKHITV